MSDAPEIDESIASHVPATTQENPLVGQIKSFAAGGFGGICAVSVGHPFDLIKVRLQTATPGTYNGAMDVVKQTIARDGFKGLYRGVAAPLVGVTPMFAISFWGYDLGKRIVSATSETGTNGELSIAQISAAGFISALPMTAVAAPFERIKVILQLQGQQASQSAAKAVTEGAAAAAPKQFTGAIDVAAHLYKTGGLKSVFKGSVATFARDGPGSALYFATYEYLKRRLTPEGSTMSLGAISFAGGMAGVAMWVPVFPIDTIKSNLQSSTKSQSIAQVTKSIYQSGGLKAFFPGIGPALARSFPANAATFVGVELAYSFFTSVGI